MHQWNGYYRIESTYSDLVLTAPTGFANSVVTQTSYASQDTQVWKFIEQSDGTYKISPESNSNYFMAAGDLSSTADQDLEIRTAQSDGGDKWMLRRATLKCWYSDSNTAYAWVKKPSSVSLVSLDGSDTSEVESSIATAMDQWNEALDISLATTAQSSADIRCFSAKEWYYYTNEMNFDLSVWAFAEFSSVHENENISISFEGQTKVISLLQYTKIYIRYEIHQVPIENQNAIITHEFGHVLGYAGHSSNSDDLMYASSQATQLTYNDIAHISQFYCTYQ